MEDHTLMEKEYRLVEPRARKVDLLCSPRGVPLVQAGDALDLTRPLLTIEYGTKWYELFLITRGTNLGSNVEWAKIYSIGFDHLEGMLDRSYREDDSGISHRNISAYSDHVPNPLYVRLFAKRHGYHLDELADELIAGRWQNEYVDMHTMECDRCEGTGQVVIEKATNLTHYIKNDSTCRACKGFGVLKPGA